MLHLREEMRLGGSSGEGVVMSADCWRGCVGVSLEAEVGGLLKELEGEAIGSILE